MRFIAALLGFLLSAAPLAAQTVQQSGSVTPGHAVKWTTTGVISDGGTASNGLLTSLGVVASGPGICQQSGPNTGALNRVCLNATATGGGISMTNVGGATGGFTFTLNGVAQGIVTSNVPTLENGFACFADTTGTIKNCASSGTLNLNSLVLIGSVSGTSTLVAPAVAGSSTITMPGATATLATLTLAETLTNKTLTAPDINGGTADSLTSLSIRDTGAAFDLSFVSTITGLSASRSITWDTLNGSRNISLAGNLTLSGTFTTSGASALTLTTAGVTNVTLPTTGTLAILGANTFIANQALTLSTDTALSYTITNANAGTSATAQVSFSNGTNGGSFGVAGTGYTAITALQNAAFLAVGSGVNSIAFYHTGDKPTIFYRSGVEIARLPVAGTQQLVLGLTGTSTGSIGLSGATSGKAIITAQATAGTPTLTLGTTSGTLAGSATSPLAISATTGVITCTTCGVTGSPLSQFAATTSAQLAGVISDETGTGVLTFATSPTFTTSITSTANATAVTPPTNTLIHSIAANSTAGQTTMDIFATFGTHTFRRANTSAASPSGLLTGDLIGGMNARGYTSSGAYTTANAAAFFFAATENWSSTATGAEVQFYTTVNTTATLLKVMTIQASGGLSIGATTDPGAGGLYVNGATITLNGLATDAAHTDRTVCQDTTSKSLFFGSGTVGICLGTSGAQFKTAFAPMTAGLDEIAKLNLLNYRYRNGYGDDGARIQYGLTAQDVETVLPDLVGHNSRGETINYDWGALLFVGLRAIQQLKADNDNLKFEVESLKQRIAK